MRHVDDDCVSVRHCLGEIIFYIFYWVYTEVGADRSERKVCRPLFGFGLDHDCPDGYAAATP